MDDITKAQLKEKLSRLVYAMKEYNAAADTYKSEISKIEAKRGVWDADYIEAQKKRVQGLGPIKAQQSEKIRKLADDFADYYQEVVNRPLDLNDNRLTNALSLINSGALDYESAKKLNQNFEGDQVALKILKNAYEKTGTPTGGIDQLVMTLGPSDIKNGLNRSAYHVIQEGGFPNHFGNAVKKVADFLAVDIDTKIQPNAMTNYMRSGANLPDDD
jgi:hypothetical protein